MFGRFHSQGEVARELGMPRKTLVDFLIQNPDLRKRCNGIQEAHKEELKRKAPIAAIDGVGAEIETDIEAIIEAADRRFELKHARAERKERQEIRFPHGPVAIIFCGDQHIGNAGTNVRRIFAEQDLIMDTPGAYVWQMGDIVDNFIVGKLMAENFKDSLPLVEQWELGKYYLKSFEDRLLAYTGGNHEAWTGMISGVDYRRDICPDGVLYDGDEITSSIFVGDYEYRVWVRHQWPGKSLYNPTHQQERAARFDDSGYDIYVGAHLHTSSVFREFTLHRQRKAAIQTGSYKVHDDFAKSKGFVRPDGSTACGVILHEDGGFFGCSSLTTIKNYMEAIYN